MTNEKENTKKIKIKMTSQINSLYASAGDLSGEVDLIWNPYKNATGYVIEVSKQALKENWKQVDITSKSHYTISGLKAGQTYKFRIAPISDKGQHEWSPEVTQKSA